MVKNMSPCYCSLWELEVNDSKTKIIIFPKRKPRTQFEFRYQGLLLEIVDEFKYLGVVFQSNGNFSKHKLYAKNQAQKAMFDVARSLIVEKVPYRLMYSFTYLILLLIQSLPTVVRCGVLKI